MVVRACCGMGG